VIEPLAFVILCLASFRITRFLVRDSLMGFGPESGSRLSVRVDKFCYNDDGTGRSWWREYAGDLVTCTWCLGSWVTLAVVCAYLRTWPQDLGVEGWAIAWAVAGAQGYLNTRLNT
jgi:hypothetical protein